MSIRDKLRTNWDDYMGVVLFGLVAVCALLILVSLTAMIVAFAWQCVVGGCP
jgi:hypothetical protein